MSALSAVDNQVQAMNLGIRWGLGRTSGAAEALQFRKAMAGTGISPRAVCALSGWLGGAVPEAELGWFSDRTSLEVACQREGYASVDLVAAMDELQRVSPLLMAVVYVKATAKQEAEKVSVALNKAQATQRRRDAVADALDAASREVEAVIKDPSKITDVMRKAAGLISKVQLSTVDLIFAAIPGGRLTVAVGAVVLLVVGGVYVKTVMRI